MDGPVIYIPNSVREPRYRCVVPTGSGACGKPFYDGEESAFARHAAKCAAEHADKIHAASPRTALPGFLDPAEGPVELEAWMKKHRVAVLEGRKKP